MVDKHKYHLKSIHKSQNPSTVSTPSKNHSESANQKSKVVETSPSSLEVVRQPPSSDYTPSSLEVYSLI